MNDSTIVHVLIPALLRNYCGGAREFDLPAEQLREALAELERRYPSLHAGVCDETGAIRRHINVFVNTAHIRDLNGLDTCFVSGDVLTFLPAVSGG